MPLWLAHSLTSEASMKDTDKHPITEQQLNAQRIHSFIWACPYCGDTDCQSEHRGDDPIEEEPLFEVVVVGAAGCMALAINKAILP